MRRFLNFSLLFLLFAGHGAVAESALEKEGHKAYEEILQGAPIYQDEKLVNYVKALGQKIVAVSSKPDAEFTFDVIDDETINAFALPGGYIFIHRGLIGYLNSEAELAAVLAHEVAHVTRRHHSRQRNAAAGSQFAAAVLGILTRSGDVAEAGALWGQAVVSGFGREMELEADESGADYLYKAGYDPQAMIDVVALLKDNERLQKKKDKVRGKKTRNYHGLFATHPRNDKRLREVIARAGQLPEQPDAELNVTPFRIATDGMIWGKHYGSRAVPENIYQDEKRAFRVTIPPGWAFTAAGTGIEGKKEDESARMTVMVKARTLESPSDYIKNQLIKNQRNIPLLKKSEPLRQNRLQGHTGMVPGNHGDKRLAVIYYGRNAYIFEGEILDAGASKKDVAALDDEMMAAIRSFRPVSKRALAGRQSRTIRYVKATSTTTFARLAQYLKLGQFGEEDLRVINGYYPRGEPKPGEWIKIIKKQAVPAGP